MSSKSKNIKCLLFSVFLGISSVSFAAEQKTAYGVATTLFATLSPLKFQSFFTLIDKVKYQSEAYQVDEKEIIKELIRKLNSCITSYERTQKQPKNEFFDSTLFFSFGSVYLLLGGLGYFCSEDRSEIREKGHF